MDGCFFWIDKLNVYNSIIDFQANLVDHLWYIWKARCAWHFEGTHLYLFKVSRLVIATCYEFQALHVKTSDQVHPSEYNLVDMHKFSVSIWMLPTQDG